MSALAAAAITDNPELRAEMVEIMRLMLNRIKKTVKVGDPKEVAVYARQLVPLLMRSVSDAEAGGDGKAELRAEFEAVMAAVRGDA